MKNRLFSVAIIAALVVSIFSPISTSASFSVQDRPVSPILLKAFSFLPSRVDLLDIPSSLRISGFARNQFGYYIVQFQGPIEQAWKDQLHALGVEIVEYIPEFAYKVRMTPIQVRRVERIGSVSWVGIFQPAYKLSPDLRRDGMSFYQIRLEKGVNALPALEAIAGTGAQVLISEGDQVILAADSTALDAIARVTDVAWIENFVLWEKHNEFGGGSILGSNTANSNGYDGSTQTVAVADTGLGGGTPSTAHRDIPSGRVTAIYNWPGAAGGCFASITDDGAADVDSGHGTHTAGSVVSGGAPNGKGRGVAPGANLVFQSVENYATISSICQFLYGYTNGYYLTGLPSDLRQLFQQAYNAGARIHSNSWGAAVAGVYNANSANTDDFVWNHRDMTITFSAGNNGRDANRDGVVDNDSIGSPGTAKNVITVGASENARGDNYPCDAGLSYTTCGSQGGVNSIATYGASWPSDFPANPLRDDPAANNQDQMAGFSSRGPTDDGRIKPDVVAPGTWVLSGYSDLYQQGYDAATNPRNNAYQYDGWGFPADAYYKYMGGTSMSNPLTAGAAAVVRDYYQKAYSHSASAALVKATLINSAVDMLDENNDGANDNDYPIPNNHEGWGRVNLAAATDGTAEFVDQSAGLATGGSTSYTYNIGSSGSPLKISLVWSDYPSTASASKNLVNDLDLVVTAPGGATYGGNVFSGGWSQAGGGPDRTNNVENVYIQSAQPGSWTVEVRGYNVPNGPQPFALVVDGSFGQPANHTPVVDIVNPAEKSTVSGVMTIQINASDVEDAAGTLAVEWNLDSGSWQPASYNGGTGYYEATLDTTTVNDGSHVINARAADSGSAAGTDANNFTVSNAPPPPSEQIYISSTTNGNAGGVAFSDEDILIYDTGVATWTMFFDGSDVGLGNGDVDAFAFLGDGTLLLSFEGSATLSGMSVDDSDIVRFTPTSTGATTAGTFEMYFDGSDVGLSTNDEDVDAFAFTADNKIVISTLGNVSVTGASGVDEDLLVFTPTQLGSTTSGTWAMYFDGSDVGLNNSASEDINGTWIDKTNGKIYLTAAGSFSVSGISGDGADVFTCTPGSLGSTTSCTFGPGLYWDGSQKGFAGEVADAIEIVK